MRNIGRIRARRRAWRAVGVGLSALALTVLPRAGSAQAPTDPAPTSAGPATFEFGALVDGYYGYHWNQPEGDAPLRNFDTRHDQAALSMAQVWFSSQASAEHRAGFNVKLNFGHASSLINAYEPGTDQSLQFLEQAYVSYLAPLGKGLQVDAGKFVTPLGAEVIEARDDWNYSRSLLFALAIPYYHMGARLTYSASDRVALSGYVVNGWNNVVENNSGKTFGAQIAVKPAASLSVVANYMAGPEQPGNTAGWRHIFDTTATFAATPRLNFMANYDYGTDTVGGAAVHWTGVAGYARYQANSWLAFSPRLEWYDDPQGATTGIAQTLKEVTVTVECKAADNLLVRGEYRTDVSDVPFFKNDLGAAVSHQPSFTIGVLYSFVSRR
jgi:hypothetical protein